MTQHISRVSSLSRGSHSLSLASQGNSFLDCSGKNAATKLVLDHPKENYPMQPFNPPACGKRMIPSSESARKRARSLSGVLPRRAEPVERVDTQAIPLPDCEACPTVIPFEKSAPGCTRRAPLQRIKADSRYTATGLSAFMRGARLTENQLHLASEEQGSIFSPAELVPVLCNLLDSECRFMPSPSYMSTQPAINESMRIMLIDWLMELHFENNLSRQTLYIAVNLLDRFLSTHPISRESLLLVGITAMFVAWKYEEVNPPKVKDFVRFVDGMFQEKEILLMESMLLNAVKFEISMPTSYDLLRGLLQLRGIDHGELSEAAQYLTEVALQDYRFLQHRPSLVASAALHVAACRRGMYVDTLYAMEDVLPCANELERSAAMVPLGPSKTLFKKYDSYSRFRVSRMLAQSQERRDIHGSALGR